MGEPAGTVPGRFGDGGGALTFSGGSATALTAPGLDAAQILSGFTVEAWAKVAAAAAGSISA